MSDYDEVNYESDENKMKDSLETFDGVINGEFFKTKPIIIFWNKKDMLEKKITQKDDLSKTFPQYKGGKDYNQALEFIQKLFKSKIPKEAQVSEYIGHAINEESISQIFSILQEITYKIKKEEIEKFNKVSKAETLE